MSMPLIRRLLQHETTTTKRSRTDGGYSLPIVILVAATLIAGGATLVARSGSVGFGAAFQRQTWNARSIADYGMTTLVSRLNKEQNRHLLAGPEANPGGTYLQTLWNPQNSANITSIHRNPCIDYTTDASGNKIYVSPTLNDIYPGGNKGGWWYVTANGQVSANPQGSIGRFKLIDGKDASGRDRFRMAVEEELNIWRPTGKSTLTLTVVAELINGGETNVRSRAVLETVYDVAPKCCKVPFGASHGSNDYTRVFDPNGNPFGISQCDDRSLNPESFGIIYGAGGEGGSMTTKGRATEVWWQDEENANQKTYINPVTCVTTDPVNDSCSLSGEFNKVSDPNRLIETVDAQLPRAPEYFPGIATALPIPAVLGVCASPAKTTGNDCRQISIGEAATTDYFRYCLDNKCSRTYINGNANPNPLISGLPSNCSFAPQPGSGGDGNLHCLVSKIDLGNNGKLQFVTGVRTTSAAIPTITPIRIYFPNASTGSTDFIINQTGSALVEHCIEATLDPSAESAKCKGSGLDPTFVRTTQLSMFGCNMPLKNPDGTDAPPYYGTNCGPQYFKLQGNASTLSYYSYFPKGNIELIGNSDISGVIWADNISVTGSGDFIVPSSGVGEVFELLGINPGIDNTCYSSIYGQCPEENYAPKWDFVARSVRRFTFRAG